jgi:exopolysaccharide biosynthesis WecB/TagA/CpsF family protein
LGQYYSIERTMQKINILNICIDNLSAKDLLGKLVKEGGVVFTPNVDHVIKLQQDKEFYQAYQIANYKVCDSQILVYASKFLGTPIQEKISGSDLFPAFCHHSRTNEEIKIFLLGGAKGVAKRAARRINQKVGREIVIAAHSPSYGFEKNEKECLEIVDKINCSGATVLAIGVGAPKQEKWIYKYRSKLSNIKIILAVGATIDFESGTKRRAPKWISDLGLEWCHRLLSEPKRLSKRYLVDDLPFFWLIVKQKFKLYRSDNVLESEDRLTSVK